MSQYMPKGYGIHTLQQLIRSHGTTECNLSKYINNMKETRVKSRIYRDGKP